MRLSTLIWEALHPFQTARRRVARPLRIYTEAVFAKYRAKTNDGLVDARELLLKAGILALIVSIVIWISVFLYVAFYYTYIPSTKHARPVHFQYKSCDEQRGICSFPSAHVRLTKRHQLLMVGQTYKISVDLEMPESEVNRNLGMFMCCAELRARGGKLAASSCRSGILPYRSPLLNVITTFVMAPWSLMGVHQEKQTVHLELFSSFEDDQIDPVTEVYVEIQSRHIELYSASLYIDAHFTGLRYVMFNWPYLSAAVGVSTNLLFVSLICALSWYHLQSGGVEETTPEIDSKPFHGGGTENFIFDTDESEKDSVYIKKEEGEYGENETPESSVTEDSSIPEEKQM